MTAFPSGVYDPRTKENKSGVVYEAEKTTVGFVEDVTKLDDEVVAIETELGTTPSGAYATVKAWLTALASLLDTHKTRHQNAGADEINVAGLSGELADEQKSNFLKLSDTPANYSGQAGKFPKVNSGENALEFADAGAGDVGGLYGINIETLTGNKTLTVGTNKIYQYLDPNSISNRIITLDTASASAGDRFVIRHNGDNSDYLYLEIKQSAISLDYIYAGSIKEFIFDGTNWISGENGSGENNTKAENIGIGKGAAGFGGGVAVGKNSKGNSGGVAVGQGSFGPSSGVAVGKDATGYSGVAVGQGASGYTSGVAVGRVASGNTYGIGIGQGANGNNFGVAIGVTTKTNSKTFSIALGYRSETERVGELSRNINGDDQDQENNIIIQGWDIETANATPTEILCGGQASQRFTIRAKSVLSFKIQVAGRDNVSGDVAIYHFKGGIKRDGSGNTVLLTTTKDIIHEDDASWDVAVTADDTNEALVITVTGDASNIVQWVARMDGVETHF